jgi:hypothetical protein
MVSQLRFLLTLFTILCFTTIASASVQKAHAGFVFEKTWIFKGVSHFPVKFLAANSAPARVFWSGGSEARLAAEAFAKQSGGVTLEMTAAGQRLQGITKGMEWADAKPLWEAASADFARGASGSVNVFQNGTRGVSLESVWRGVEYPILKQQGNGIIYNVTKP